MGSVKVLWSTGYFSGFDVNTETVMSMEQIQKLKEVLALMAEGFDRENSEKQE